MVTRLLIRAIVTVIVLAIAAGLSMAMRAYLRRRAKALDAGCVACGSHELETRDAEVRCRSCGYVGRADGGGTLSVAELQAIRASDHEQP